MEVEWFVRVPGRWGSRGALAHSKHCFVPAVAATHAPPHAPAHVFDVEEQLRARLEPEAVEVEVLHTARNAAGVQKWQSQLGVPRK